MSRWRMWYVQGSPLSSRRMVPCVLGFVAGSQTQASIVPRSSSKPQSERVSCLYLPSNSSARPNRPSARLGNRDEVSMSAVSVPSSTKVPGRKRIKYSWVLKDSVWRRTSCAALLLPTKMREPVTLVPSVTMGSTAPVICCTWYCSSAAAKAVTAVGSSAVTITASGLPS